MSHPNWLDRLRARHNPSYLYPGQVGINFGPITAGIIHLSPSNKEIIWNVVDYRQLKKGSLLKFLGYAHQLRVGPSLEKYTSIFETIQAISDFPVNAGDVLAVSPSDRKAIAPAPTEPTPPTVQLYGPNEP